MSGEGDLHGPDGRDQDDGPRKTTKEGTDRDRDRSNEGLPAHGDRQLRRELPDNEDDPVPVGRHGVPGGWRPHRRRHGNSAQRVADRGHLSEVSPGELYRRLGALES